MRTERESIGEAEENTAAAIEGHMNDAVNDELKGEHRSAMENLGRAIHVVQDGFSPSHKGYKVWSGMSLKRPLTIVKAVVHAARELWPSKTAREASNAATRKKMKEFQERVAKGRKAEKK